MEWSGRAGERWRLHAGHVAESDIARSRRTNATGVEGECGKRACWCPSSALRLLRRGLACLGSLRLGPLQLGDASCLGPWQLGEACLGPLQLGIRTDMVGLKPTFFLPHNCCLRDRHFLS